MDGTNATTHMIGTEPCGCNIANAIQCHSLSSLTVTMLSCSLQLPLLAVMLSGELDGTTLPLPLDEPDEPVLIDAKEDKELAPSENSIHTQCTDTSNHEKLAVQVDTVTVNLQYRQAQETFYQRHLIWSQYFWGLHFPNIHYGL